jgi:hypothetical protein
MFAVVEIFSPSKQARAEYESNRAPYGMPEPKVLAPAAPYW